MRVEEFLIPRETKKYYGKEKEGKEGKEVEAPVRLFGIFLPNRQSLLSGGFVFL